METKKMQIYSTDFSYLSKRIENPIKETPIKDAIQLVVGVLLAAAITYAWLIFALGVD